MKTIYSLGLLAALALLPRCGKGPEPAVSAVDREGGITVLRLSGTPREKGRFHGRALRERIRAWLERTRPREEGLAAFAIDTCGERLLPFLSDGVREELEGIAEGAGLRPLEVLYLSTRFELAAHGFGAGSGAAGDAAVSAAAEVRALLDPGEVGGRPEELLVVVHEDRDPPLVLVALPGMVGGFLGLSGRTAAALRPLPGRSRPVLHGLVWTILLRALLEDPPAPGRPLPAPVTLDASAPFASGGAAGTLNLAPSGGTWYPAPGGFAAVTDEDVTGEGGSVTRGAREAGTAALAAERARRLLVAEPPAGLTAVHLGAGERGFSVRMRRAGVWARRVVRFGQ